MQRVFLSMLVRRVFLAQEREDPMPQLPLQLRRHHERASDDAVDGAETSIVDARGCPSIDVVVEELLELESRCC